MKLKDAPEMSREVAQGAVDSYIEVVRKLKDSQKVNESDKVKGALYQILDDALFDLVEKVVVVNWGQNADVNILAQKYRNSLLVL